MTICKYPWCGDDAYIGELYCLKHLAFISIKDYDEADHHTDDEEPPIESKKNTNEITT